MLKRLRKINKAKLIESSRRVPPKAPPSIPLPKAYAALLAAGVTEDKARLMVEDATTCEGVGDCDYLAGVVVWAYTKYEADWREAASK